MNKILGVIVLGMLLSGCISPGDNTYSGFQKYWETESGKKTAKVCPKNKLKKEGGCKINIWSSKLTQKDANEHALSLCKKNYSECKITMEGNKTVYTYEDSKSSEIAKIINDSKKTCNSLGFKEGSEKFTDCTLRLYTQEVDNKIALSVSKQQSSSSGTMTISDPVRDRQNQIDRGMKMLGGGCTLGIDC